MCPRGPCSSCEYFCVKTKKCLRPPESKHEQTRQPHKGQQILDARMYDAPKAEAPSNRRQVAVLFDGSLEGFLCILHAYYYERICPLMIQVEGLHQMTLDSEEYFVTTDYDKAMKVNDGIIKKISPAAERHMVYAFLSEAEDKFITIFRYLVLGFKVGPLVDDHLQEDCVLRILKLSRYVGREAHLLNGFCRFQETTNGIFYCSIEPKNYVLPIICEHFRDRMMNQQWIIHDKVRGKAAVYNGDTYVITDVPKSAEVVFAENEDKIQELWTTFFNSVNIKERVNPKVQRNLLPLHFRKSMTEFQLK